MSKKKPKPITITHKNGNLWKVTLVCVITIGLNMLIGWLMKLCGIPDWLDFIPSVLLMGVLNLGAMRVYFDLFEKGNFDLRGIVHPFTSPMLYKDALIISAVCYAVGLPDTLALRYFTYTPGTPKPVAMLILAGFVLMFAYSMAGIFFIFILRYRRATAAGQEERPLESARAVLRIFGSDVFGVISKTFAAYMVPALMMVVVLIPAALISIKLPVVRQVAVAVLVIPMKALADIRMVRLRYRICEPERIR